MTDRGALVDDLRELLAQGEIDLEDAERLIRWWWHQPQRLAAAVAALHAPVAELEAGVTYPPSADP